MGGTISLDPVPSKAFELALRTTQLCHWDDVGIDICKPNGSYFVLEANMK
ncbi:MAG: hypothetical protein ACE5HX_18065 [bacterium]